MPTTSPTPSRRDRRSVVVVLGQPGTDSDACVAALKALRDVLIFRTRSPEVAAGALQSSKAALAVVAAGSPESWADEMLVATASCTPPVPLLVLVGAGQATPHRWTRAGVATLRVPSSLLALARTISLLLAGRSSH